MAAPASSSCRKATPPGRHGTCLKAAIVGYGHFGHYHATKYAALDNSIVAAIVDTDRERRDVARQHYPAANIFESVEALLKSAPPDLASVTVPASQHFAVARRLLAAGVHLLVEKPLAVNLDCAWSLSQLAQQKSLLLVPGHLERFHRHTQDLARHCPAPKFIETRRLARWSGRGGDVDAVMDLMIHDIDLVKALVDAPLAEVRARGAKRVTDFWDLVQAQLRFVDGSEAMLWVSRAATHNERAFHLYNGVVCATLDALGGHLALSRAVGDALTTDTYHYPRSDALAAEVREFVEAVAQGREAMVSARDGLRALELARCIVDAIEPDTTLVHRSQRVPALATHMQYHVDKQRSRNPALAD